MLYVASYVYKIAVAVSHGGRVRYSGIMNNAVQCARICDIQEYTCYICAYPTYKRVCACSGGCTQCRGNAGLDPLQI